MGKIILFVLLISFVICASSSFSFWEPKHKDIHAELSKKWKSVGIQYCQSFPELSPIPPKYEPLLELINEFSLNISQLVTRDGTPSVTVNLIYDQDILWTQGYGLKDINNKSSGVPTGDTVYQIGSNTKVFTALLALIAQDKGLLSLTDEVSKHVPEFSPINPFPSKRSINFAQLASHMAGLSRESPCGTLTNTCNQTNDEMWPLIQNVTLVNPPGFVPSYSNLGFAVLGHALEGIMGDTWDNLIKNEILDPLGMSETGTELDNYFLENRAIGYTAGNQVPMLLDFGWEAPAGSIYSSTNDMAKFVSFFFRDDIPYMSQPNQILDSLSIREWRQPRYINIDLTGYGMPWEIFSSPIIYTKAGGTYGYVSYTVTIPRLKLGMVILQSSDVAPTLSEIFGLFASNFVVPFAQILQTLAPPPFIPPSFSSFVGNYIMENTTVTVSIVQASYPVPVLGTGGTFLPLQYISENVFKLTTQGAALDCSTKESGIEQYVYFYESSPLSFTIPGSYPGVFAIKM